MCTDEQHASTIATLERIEKLLKPHDPIMQTVPIADSLSFVVDYKDMRYLFIWSTTALTLNAGSQGTFNLSAESWLPLAFRPGTQITTSGQSTPVMVNLLATDNYLSASSSSLISSGLALESGGNLAAVEAQTAKLLFDGNQYLKTTILNGSHQVNVASSGGLYTVQATNNASVPTGAGNTVVKNSAGALVSIVVTTAGTGSGNVLVYDNASTNSGTVLFALPATVSVATFYIINGWALAGITIQNVLNGPVLTVFYS